MKPIFKHAIPFIIVSLLLIQCDTVSPGSDMPSQEILGASIDSQTTSAGQTVEHVLEWSPVEGAQEYRVRISETEEFDFFVVQSRVEGTSYTVTLLSPDKVYYWKISPVKSEDSDSWSERKEFRTGSVAANAAKANTNEMTLIAPIQDADKVTTDLEFSWRKFASTSEYEYQLSDNRTFNSILHKTTVKGTSYKPVGLVHQKRYHWRVRPNIPGAQWSEVRTFTTGIKGRDNWSGKPDNDDSDNPGNPDDSDDEIMPPPPPSSSGDFVTTYNANFVLNGEVFRFAGTNAYYLPNYEKLNPSVVNRALNLFEETGITVVRMWGFYDGYDCGYSKNDSSESVIQTSPGVYNEQALRHLDNVIAKGKERGLRFIIPFVNYWDELGGICQYNTWAGASNPSQNMEFFMNNSQTQKWYKDYISMLLNRVNTVTGVRYKDEPAIFAWQIMNEGRNRDGNPADLRDWYREIARYIKSIDSNHLVSTGEEGFDERTPSEYSVEDYSNTYVLRAQLGTSYILNTAILEIDFGSAHWYPNEWGFGNSVNESMLTAQRAWLRDHQQIASNVGKPLYIGEFGYPGWADNRVVEMYDAFYKDVEALKIDGALLWQLVADGTKCWEFGGNICYPDGRTDTNLYNSFKRHVNNMNNLK